jgi:hypothetical protein
MEQSALATDLGRQLPGPSRRNADFPTSHMPPLLQQRDGGKWVESGMAAFASADGNNRH